MSVQRKKRIFFCYVEMVGLNVFF